MKNSKIELLKHEINVSHKYLLKDGRTIWKSHNCFRSWCMDKRGHILPVTEEYYNQALKNK